MPTDLPADDVRKSRAAQRAERLERLRATAWSTVIENPAPRGLPAGEPAIIAGGLPCQDEILADMALPLPELPATEQPPRKAWAGGAPRASASAGLPVQNGPAHETLERPVSVASSRASQVVANGAGPGDVIGLGAVVAPQTPVGKLAASPASVAASSPVENSVHNALRSQWPAPAMSEAPAAAPSASASAFSATGSESPPMAQPSSQIFRFDAAEGLSPRPPFAMPAFSLAKDSAAGQPESTEPSAYPVGELYRQVRQNVLGQLAAGQAAIAWICPTGSEPLSDHLVELASALAEGCDGEVLLVDANFQTAALTRRFNLGEKSGLADVLAKKLAAHAAGHETAVARVRVLPKGGDSAGRASRRANEEDWRTLLSGLKERYRYVLIDAPGVEEPHCLPLAKAADAAFVAIALDHTPRETVQEALEHLHLHKARVAGCVITEAPV